MRSIMKYFINNLHWDSRIEISTEFKNGFILSKPGVYVRLSTLIGWMHPCEPRKRSIRIFHWPSNPVLSHLRLICQLRLE